MAGFPQISSESTNHSCLDKIYPISLKNITIWSFGKILPNIIRFHQPRLPRQNASNFIKKHNNLKVWPHHTRFQKQMLVACVSHPSTSKNNIFRKVARSCLPKKCYGCGDPTMNLCVILSGIARTDYNLPEKRTSDVTSSFKNGSINIIGRF